MSAPRTNAAIADRLEHFFGKLGGGDGWDAVAEAIAALRKEPPALPAEVEAVLAKLLREADALSAGTLEDDADLAREAATLLRRYAQAVTEKDAEIAEMAQALLFKPPAPKSAYPHDGATCEESEADRAILWKKLQAVEALCESQKAFTTVSREGILRALREEH